MALMMHLLWTMQKRSWICDSDYQWNATFFVRIPAVEILNLLKRCKVTQLRLVTIESFVVAYLLGTV